MKTASKSAHKTLVSKQSNRKSIKAGARKPVESASKERFELTAKIIPTVADNPRRKGTFGYNSFNKIRKGMTVEQFINKGGRLKDLHWDVNKGHVKVLGFPGNKAA